MQRGVVFPTVLVAAKLGPNIRAFLDRETEFAYRKGMTDQMTQPSASDAPSTARGHAGLKRVSKLSPWSLGAVVIAALVMMPLLAVVWIAFHPTDNIWPHLWATTLPRYMMTTGLLAAGVALLAACVGTGAAWLITMYRFPFSKALE